MLKIDKDLPVILLENEFKEVKGQKEFITFDQYISIAVRGENYVFVLGWEIDGNLIIRKFADKKSALKELDLSINLDNAIEVSSQKYDFDFIKKAPKLFLKEKTIKVIH